MIKPSRDYDFAVVRDGVSLRDAPATPRERKPDWLKVALPSGIGYKSIKDIVDLGGLTTVCQEAMCPNIAECWSAAPFSVTFFSSSLKAVIYPFAGPDSGDQAQCAYPTASPSAKTAP